MNMAPRNILRELCSHLGLKRKNTSTPETYRYKYISRVPSKKYKHTFDSMYGNARSKTNYNPNICDGDAFHAFTKSGSMSGSMSFILPLYIALRL